LVTTPYKGIMSFLKLCRPLLSQLGAIIVTLFGLIALTFFISRIVPIDPVLLVIGDKADQVTYQRVYLEMGLDQPLLVQFAIFLERLASLDFGRSVVTGNAVVADIARVFPATLELAFVSLMIAVAIGIPLGAVAAAHHGKWPDNISRLVLLVGYSAPGFWLGLMGLMLFYATLGWLPGPGRLDVVFTYTFRPISGFLLFDSAISGSWDVFGDAVRHMILPATILGYSAAAYIGRMTRSLLLDELNQDYVLTARAKGLAQHEVLIGHAFRAIGVQLLTVVAITFGFMLDGAVLVETIFAWPGFGRYVVGAMLAADMNAMVASVLLIGACFVIVNLITDLLYRVLDPRTAR
jgi:peptide/nickel transport system permease protein